MASGDFCFVMSGSTNAGYGFINSSTANPIVIGTDNITYTPFNAAQTLTNGSGINLVSNVLSVDTTTIQARVADVSDTEIGYLNGVTSAIQTQIDAKAPTNSPTFTGTVTLPNNTVALGTQTTGDYVASLVAGTGVTITNNTGETATPTVAIGQSVATSATPTFASLTTTGNVNIGTGTGDEGGEMLLVKPATNTSIAGTGVTIDIWQNRLRIFEQGGSTRGAFIDLTACNNGVLTNLLGDVVTSAQTASYTLTLQDKGDLVEMLVGSANNLTVPPNSSVPFPIGTQINILQTGTGQTTVVAGSGVTVNATPGLKIRAQWSYATLIKRGTDTWVLVGDISA
jgi:hypothetical protein